MKSASSLLTLAKRCEEATGPDRELDVAIWEAIFGGTDNYLSLIKRSGDWFVRYYPSPPGPEYYRLKSYTDSLDAALKLIPDGWQCDVSGGNSDFEELPFANVFPKQQPFPAEFDFVCDGTSPALALCAAALRAHAASFGNAS